jgi:hypothetical protein
LLQLLHEYDTLCPSYMTNPLCFCGKRLYDLDIKATPDGASWTYAPCDPNAIKRKHATFCSSDCEQAQLALVAAQQALAADKAAPELPSTASFLTVPETAADVFIPAEISHYGALLQVDADGREVTARQAITPGMVLCGVPGVIQPSDKPTSFLGAKHLDLKEALRRSRRLAIDPRCLAARVRWVDTAAEANTSLVANSSMLTPPTSLWQQSQCLAPGAFVLVAEQYIPIDEPIKMYAEQTSANPLTYAAPKPAYYDGAAPAASLTEADGIRLPGDHEAVLEEGEEPDLRPAELLKANMKRLKVHDGRAQIKRAVEQMVEATPAGIRKALKACMKDSNSCQELFDSLLVFKGRPIFMTPLSNQDHVASVAAAYAALKQVAAESERIGIAPDGSKQPASPFAQYDATDVAQVATAIFDPASKECQCGPAFDTSTEAVQARHSQIVNLQYLKHFDAVLSTPASREALRAAMLAEQQKHEAAVLVQSAVSAIVSGSLCSELFNTLSLSFPAYKASMECLDGWIHALEYMLQDSGLLDRLKRAQALFKSEWQLDFQPWVVLQSLDGKLYKLKETLDGQSSNSQPLTDANGVQLADHLRLCVLVCPNYSYTEQVTLSIITARCECRSPARTRYSWCRRRRGEHWSGSSHTHCAAC